MLSRVVGGQNVPIRKEVDANSAKGWGGGPIKKPLDYSCPIGQMKMCRGALLVIIFCIYVMLLGDVYTVCLVLYIHMTVNNIH